MLNNTSVLFIDVVIRCRGSSYKDNMEPQFEGGLSTVANNRQVSLFWY